MWDRTYNLGHISKWNRLHWITKVSAEDSPDFIGCDSPKLKIFTDSHFDRPECLWQLSICRQTSSLEIHFAIFCAPEEWPLPMAKLPDYTIASWPHNLIPLKALAGHTCSKQYWLPFKQAYSFQLQKKKNLHAIYIYNKMLEEFSFNKPKRVSRT